MMFINILNTFTRAIILLNTVRAKNSLGWIVNLYKVNKIWYCYYAGLTNICFNFQPLILVAGGCGQVCIETEAGMKSAEIYYPKTNEWKQVHAI
jgi:hypothetical protein